MRQEASSTFERERLALLTGIESAFGDVRLGSGVSLHQARAMDDSESAKSIATARALDPEERWQDISDEKLDELSDTLPFMDEEGFRFYIPRFMTFALQHEASGSWARDSAIYWANMEERAGEHLALLSNEQREVIKSFFEFHADEA